MPVPALVSRVGTVVFGFKTLEVALVEKKFWVRGCGGAVSIGVGTTETASVPSTGGESKSRRIVGVTATFGAGRAEFWFARALRYGVENAGFC